METPVEVKLGGEISKGHDMSQVEKQRQWVGTWQRWHRRARAWNGKITGRGGLENVKELQEVMHARYPAYNETGNRKEAVVQACEAMLKEARRTQQASTHKVGDRLLEKMREAQDDNTGNRLVKVYEEVRRAMGKSTAGAGKMLAVRNEEGKVVRGPEVREVVARLGDKVNGPKEIEPDALKDFIGLGSR